MLPRCASFALLLGAFAALAVPVSATAAGSSSTIALDEHSAGITPGSNPRAIVRGADGAMWFTEIGSGFPTVHGGIGRIAANGDVQEFREGLPGGAAPRSIVRGADGNVWFGDPATRRVGRITRRGAITTFPTGVPKTQVLRGLATGGDGNVWFMADGGRTIGRVTPAGTVRRWSRPAPRKLARFGSDSVMAAGPDGRVWLVSGRWLGRIALGAGRVDWRLLPGGRAGAAIAPGLGRTMWVAHPGGGLARLDRHGRPLRVAAQPPLSGRQALAQTPDGTLWMTEEETGDVVEMRGGDVTFHRNPPKDEGPAGLRPVGVAIGSDGRPWITGADRVAHVRRGRACRVPDVVGMTQERAADAVRAAGCAAAVRQIDLGGAGPVRVVAQSVERRRAVARGATVTLDVGPDPVPCRWPEGVVESGPVDGGILAGGSVRVDRTRGEHRTYVCVPATGFVGLLRSEKYDDRDFDDPFGTDGSSLIDVVVSMPFVLTRDAWYGSKGAYHGDIIRLVNVVTGEARELASVEGPLVGDVRLDGTTASWTEDGVLHTLPVRE